MEASFETSPGRLEQMRQAMMQAAQEAERERTARCSWRTKMNKEWMERMKNTLIWTYTYYTYILDKTSWNYGRETRLWTKDANVLCIFPGQW